MSNRITIELSAEDRARLDRLAEALERCAILPTVEEVEVTTTPEPVEETTIIEEVVEESTKTVDRADLRAKVIELSAKGLKEETRDVVRAYAQTVSGVPEDKVAECYEKLARLEAKG